MLLVGDSCCFLVNAACHNQSLYVGTMRSISLKANPRRERTLEDIKQLVLRFASPNATVSVYYLHNIEGSNKLIGPLRKNSQSFV